MTLSGIIETIIFKNTDTGFTVLNLETKEESVAVVGILPLVAEGEQIEIEGEFMIHMNYGKQFVVVSFKSRLPVGETAILRYLSSGIVKGVRAKTAKLILDRFGPQTLDVLESEPERLTEIKGISLDRAKKISESMKENIGVKSILLYFQQFGITTTFAFKIFKQWGLRAYDILKANPYRLCEIEGISFEKADEVAGKMDYDLNSAYRVQSGIIYILNYNLYNNGHVFLPKYKLIDAVVSLLEVENQWVSDNLDIIIENQTLVYIDKIDNTNGVYLRWAYDCEKNITNRVILASKFMQNYNGDFNADIKKAEAALNLTFAEIQKIAIKEACCHQMMILTGGPGTGKTTALNGIIKIFENKGITFTIAAPTGRAAKRVTELTGKEAKTIHRLLEYGNQNGENTFTRNKDNPLKYDAVIIDESSMVDLWLFNYLLDAIPANTKIIMVGDSNQLQPVGPGSVFKDIIGSGIIATIELKEIFRQAEKSLIVTNAHRIINGLVPDLKNTKNDFFFIPANTPEDVIKKVTELCASRLPNAYNFNPLTDIQVLSPTRKTTTGTVSLNIALKNAINPADEHKKELKFRENTYREGDKIMQVRNNYDITVDKANGEIETGVFNGDIGIVEEILDKEEGLIVRYDDKKVVYTVEMLEDIELAYAITVHKSQGSEFNAVILPLFEGANMLYTRNLLYTAVTRAKKILVIVGSPQKVIDMVKNNVTDKRYSGLKFQIWAMNN